MKARPKLVCFATQGEGGSDEQRILALLQGCEPEKWPYRRQGRWRNFPALVRYLLAVRPALVVMEGTGVPGGLALIMARLLSGQKYLVSSGDAVAPFLKMRWPWVWPLALLYESLLYRLATGFIGWSPYLAGRALTMGAPRAVTAAGYCGASATPADGTSIRRQLAIPERALVVGIVGNLNWDHRHSYCYGVELVKALALVKSRNIWVLIVGGGSGLERLKEMAQHGPQRICFTGPVSKDRVLAYLSAMDIASMPQSLDGVGLFRYTTKISEYLRAGLPVLMTRTPMAYDLDSGWVIRLPGDAPWHPKFVAALADYLDRLTPEDLSELKDCAKRASLREFDEASQKERVAVFVGELMET